MARASAEAAAATARRVLDAATTLFAARGFAGVGLEEIARRAEVTRGAVYHHYADKEGLFTAVAARLQADVADAVVGAAEAAGSDPTAQLRAGSHAFLDAITSGPAVRILLLDGPAVVGWTAWREMDAANSGTHLREALAAIGVTADVLDALTAQLSGAMNEAALWVAANPAGRDAAHTALDRILDAAVRGG